MDSRNFDVITLSVVDPKTVCCEEALLAAALQTLGVPGVKKHERDCSFEILEVAGQDGAMHTVWFWFFELQSACGTYKTAKLIEWWQSDEWRAANPTHELTLVHTVLHNLAEEARRIRETVPRLAVRRGDLEARIPVNASPERRQHLIDQLEGRVKPGTPFASKKAEG